MSDLRKATGFSEPKVSQVACDPFGLFVIASLVMDICQNSLDRATVPILEVLRLAVVLITASLVVPSVGHEHDLIEQAFAYALLEVAWMDVGLKLKGEPIHAARVCKIGEIREADDGFHDIRLGAFALVTLADCHKARKTRLHNVVDPNTDLRLSLLLELRGVHGLLDVVIIDDLDRISEGSA